MTDNIEVLKSAYHEAFSQLGIAAWLIVGGVVVLIAMLGWAAWLGETRVGGNKPFDPKHERKTPNRWKM